jgi:hypothetical protein
VRKGRGRSKAKGKEREKEKHTKKKKKKEGRKKGIKQESGITSYLPPLLPKRTFFHNKRNWNNLQHHYHHLVCPHVGEKYHHLCILRLRAGNIFLIFCKRKKLML